MKFVLVAVNLLLALWLLASVGSRFSTGSSGKEEFSVKKSDPGKKAAGTAGAAVKKTQAESVDSQLATIIDNNIFNPDRCPNAVFGRGRSSRVELTLVGTFEIGTWKGAIILQKTSTTDRNNFRNMMMGGMMGGPGGEGGGPGGEGGGPPDMQGQQNGNGSSRRSSSSSSSSRQSSGRTRFSGMWNRNSGSTSGTGSDSTTTTPTASVKQYVRVGETLSNGYTLTEVTRTTATLTRGSDKMELELQDPSKNQTKAATTTNNNNQRNSFMQQMQQMQQMQMMQNFQMMRMMRDSSRNQNQNQSGNRGGSSSGNSRNSGGGGGGGGPGGPPPGM